MEIGAVEISDVTMSGTLRDLEHLNRRTGKTPCRCYSSSYRYKWLSIPGKGSVSTTPHQCEPIHDGSSALYETKILMFLLLLQYFSGTLKASFPVWQPILKTSRQSEGNLLRHFFCKTGDTSFLIPTDAAQSGEGFWTNKSEPNSLFPRSFGRSVGSLNVPFEDILNNGKETPDR